MEFPDFQTYEKQLKAPYICNPIDISIGFYGLCSYQNIAWDHVFQCIRKYYPDAPIVLINDGFDQYDYSEMAIKYNCIYVKKDIEICLHYPDIASAHEFMHRTKEACELVGTDWIIHLHPDVICQNKISYMPPSTLAGVAAGSGNGVSSNNWYSSPDFQKVIEYIRKYQPTVELNGWGWCGGSIMNCQAFYKVYDSLYGNNPKFNLEDIRKNSFKGVTEHEDTMMSVLFALNGYPYRIWKDNPEYHRGFKEGAFLHGYKEHYDFKKQGLSGADYFSRVRFQNITKRKEKGLLDNEDYIDGNQKNI
jgi:hypothetical protein